MIIAIVCVDKNWGIGYQGKLLTCIPEDMRFFKEKTTNNVVIMGRKTYESLPSKPLPRRTNIVVTSKITSPCEVCEVDENGTIFVTMDFVKTFLSTLSENSPVNYFIIGGGQIYNELLPYCQKAYVTKVNYGYKNVDAHFPNLDTMNNWAETENGEGKDYKGLRYKFCVYERERELA
jgi:dihydrofolate reductase